MSEDEDDPPFLTASANTSEIISSSSLIDEVGDEACNEILAELKSVDLGDKTSIKSPDDGFADFTCLDTAETSPLSGIDSSSNFVTGNLSSQLPNLLDSSNDLFSLQ